jgi:hypothetical protein
VSDSPQIFDDLRALQQHEVRIVMAYRRELAMRLRLTAVDYEHRSAEKLNEDPAFASWAEGVAEGLRTAAAELDPEQVTA